MAETCKSCGNSISFIFNKKKTCDGCSRDICSKCASTGIEVTLCRDCTAYLKTNKHAGNHFYCAKCNNFGKILPVKCEYCDNKVCMSCVSKVGCIGNHVWCTFCKVPSREVEIPHIDWVEHKRWVKSADNGYYVYSYSRSWGRRKVRICGLDGQLVFNKALIDAIRGLDSGATPQKTSDVQSYDDFMTNVAPTIVDTIVVATGNAGFDWTKSLRAVLPSIFERWGSGKDVSVLLDGIGFSEGVRQAVCDFYGQKIGENVLDIEPKYWDAIIPHHSIQFLREHPGHAALYVWAMSKHLSDLHAGLRAVDKLTIETSFFTGMRNIIQGLIELDSRLCFDGLKNIRRDGTIPAKIMNIVATKAEEEIGHMRDFTKEDGLRIDKLVDQRGAHVGDVVSEKVGSKTEVKDSIVYKSGLGKKSTEDGAATGEGSGFRICPYCGKELNFPKPPKFCPFCEEKIRE